MARDGRADATGRSSGRFTGRKAEAFGAPTGEVWLARPLSMLTSPAWRALGINPRRILDRLEIEHLRHGRRLNGALPVAYDHFVESGIGRSEVAAAIDAVVALGFVKVMRRGCKGTVALYALTYEPIFGQDGTIIPRTDEWRAITTDEEAGWRLRNAKEQGAMRRKCGAETRTARAKNAVRKPEPKNASSGAESHTAPVREVEPQRGVSAEGRKANIEEIRYSEADSFGTESRTPYDISRGGGAEGPAPDLSAVNAWNTTEGLYPAVLTKLGDRGRAELRAALETIGLERWPDFCRWVASEADRPGKGTAYARRHLLTRLRSGAAAAFITATTTAAA